MGYLTYSGFAENSVYFLNVSEARAATPEKLTAARLFGTVAEAGLAPHSAGPGVDFRLVDKDNVHQTIDVTYSGVVPRYLQAWGRSHCGRRHGARRPLQGQNSHDQVPFQVSERKPARLTRRRPVPPIPRPSEAGRALFCAP